MCVFFFVFFFSVGVFFPNKGKSRTNGCFCLNLNLLRPLFLSQTFMKLYTQGFIEVMNND